MPKKGRKLGQFGFHSSDFQERDSRGRFGKKKDTATFRFNPTNSQINVDWDKFNPNLKEVKDNSINIRENNVLGITEITNPTINQIYEQLRTSICTLFFYKITTGAYRKMICTLVDHEPVPSKYNRPGVIVVWDLEANNWRSFYPKRIFKLIRNEQTPIE